MEPPAPPDSAPDPAQQRALEARRANQAERKANKRAELKAKAAEKRRLLEQQRAAQDEKLQQGLAVDTSHGDQAEEERERAAREALRQAHPVEAGAGARSAAKLFADGARKAAKVNEAQHALGEEADKAAARGKVRTPREPPVLPCGPFDACAPPLNC